MRDPYQVLGVLPGAPDEEVKCAFRRLAKQLHPDLHPNDSDAERAFREISTAYQTLSDPLSRMAHAAAIKSQQAARRQGVRGRAATTMVAFALTVGSVSTAMLWQHVVAALWPAPPSEARAISSNNEEPVALQEGASPGAGARDGRVASANTQAPTEPPVATASDRSSAGAVSTPPLPPDSSADAGPWAATDPAPTGLPLPPSEAASQGVLPAPSERPGPGATSEDRGEPAPRRARSWVSYRNAAFGFALQYPRDVFVADPAPADPGSGTDQGGSFLSRDGRARLIISAAVNTAGITLATHRRSLVEGPYIGAKFDYAPQRSTWYVLSGTVGEDMFYQRVTFACDGRAFHGWKLVYPVAERTFYDGIVEAVHRRYRHGNGAQGRCEVATR
jgi:hypothetical protein